MRNKFSGENGQSDVCIAEYRLFTDWAIDYEAFSALALSSEYEELYLPSTVKDEREEEEDEDGEGRVTTTAR